LGDKFRLAYSSIAHAYPFSGLLNYG
jgi:hypothetical protein